MAAANETGPGHDVDPEDDSGLSEAAPTDAAPTEAAPAVDVERAGIAELAYEDARDELAGIVSRLEAGQVPLDEAMSLWRRGEALAAHCSTWLDGAQQQVERMTEQRTN